MHMLLPQLWETIFLVLHSLQNSMVLGAQGALFVWVHLCYSVFRFFPLILILVLSFIQNIFPVLFVCPTFEQMF